MADVTDQTNGYSDVVRDLGTHDTAAVDLHITRHTKKPVIIEPGDAPGEVADENNRK